MRGAKITLKDGGLAHFNKSHLMFVCAIALFCHIFQNRKWCTAPAQFDFVTSFSYTPAPIIPHPTSSLDKVSRDKKPPGGVVSLGQSARWSSESSTCCARCWADRTRREASRSVYLQGFVSLPVLRKKRIANLPNIPHSPESVVIHKKRSSRELEHGGHVSWFKH